MIFSSNVIYIIVSEYRGVRIPDLLSGCSYNQRNHMIELYHRTRNRTLGIKEIIKDNDNEFEFIDGNGVKILIRPASIKDYFKYRNFLFNKMPGFETLLSRFRIVTQLRR